MFLSRVYKFNRLAGALAGLFLMGFIYLNYKWGFVAAPIFQYGMYSQPVKIQGERTIYQVQDPAHKEIMQQLNFYQRDQVTHYLQAFSAAGNNEHARAVFLPILSRLYMSEPPRYFGVETNSWKKTNLWLSSRIKKWLETESASLQPVRFSIASYHWNGIQLIRSNEPTTLMKDEKQP